MATQIFRRQRHRHDRRGQYLRHAARGELKAVAAGGTTPVEAKDHGFMYQHGYQDLDGHLCELFYMEPSAVKKD
jgi:hypothetical protein